MLPSTITSTLFLKLINFELLLIILKSSCYISHKEEGENIRAQETYTAKSTET